MPLCTIFCPQCGNSNIVTPHRGREDNLCVRLFVSMRTPEQHALNMCAYHSSSAQLAVPSSIERAHTTPQNWISHLSNLLNQIMNHPVFLLHHQEKKTKQNRNIHTSFNDDYLCDYSWLRVRKCSLLQQTGMTITWYHVYSYCLFLFQFVVGASPDFYVF